VIIAEQNLDLLNRCGKSYVECIDNVKRFEDIQKQITIFKCSDEDNYET